MADSNNKTESGAPAQSTGQQSSQANPLEVRSGTTFDRLSDIAVQCCCHILLCYTVTGLLTLQANKAEKIALNTHVTLNTSAMPVRQYLEATVVPVLMQGLGQVVRERPSDPVAALAAYLLKHNPQQQSSQVTQSPKV